MINTEYNYMVDFTLPTQLSQDFLDLVPFQRMVVNKLFEERKLLNYSFSLEKGKLWAIFSASSEFEVMNLIADFPLAPFMKSDIHLLSFYSDSKTHIPKFSMN